MTDIKKLIYRLKTEGALTDNITIEISDLELLDDAADALEQLQAENDRLRKERDAAVEDLNAIIGDIEEIRRCNKFKWCGPKEE